MNCAECGAPLTRDETGLSRKLISRGTETFYCLTCLSRKFNVPVSQLEELIERFRQAGCTLFT